MTNGMDELIQKMKFGSRDERFQAIVALGSVETQTERAGAILHLWPLVTDEACDFDERLWACIAVAKFGGEEALVQSAPAVFEYVKDALLNFISHCIHHHEEISPMALPEGESIRALANFQGDDRVLDGLLACVRNSSEANRSRWLRSSALRAIGALGDDKGKELLEHWRDKGDKSAKAALELFGSNFDDISRRMSELG